MILSEMPKVSKKDRYSVIDTDTVAINLPLRRTAGETEQYGQVKAVLDFSGMDAENRVRWLAQGICANQLKKRLWAAAEKAAEPVADLGRIDVWAAITSKQPPTKESVLSALKALSAEDRQMLFESLGLTSKDLVRLASEELAEDAEDALDAVEDGAEDDGAEDGPGAPVDAAPAAPNGAEDAPNGTAPAAPKSVEKPRLGKKLAKAKAKVGA